MPHFWIGEVTLLERLDYVPAGRAISSVGPEEIIQTGTTVNNSQATFGCCVAEWIKS